MVACRGFLHELDLKDGAGEPGRGVRKSRQGGGVAPAKAWGVGRHALPEWEEGLDKLISEGPREPGWERWEGQSCRTCEPRRGLYPEGCLGGGLPRADLHVKKIPLGVVWQKGLEARTS